MKNVSKILAVAAAVMLLAQPALYAQKGGDRPMRGDGKGCPMMQGHDGPMFGDPARMQKELGLTDAQLVKIADINKDHRKKMLDYREKLAPMKIQLERLLLEDTVDMARVRTLVREMSGIRAELQVLRIQHRLDIEKVLTPEQKAKMKAHRKKMMGGQRMMKDMKDRKDMPKGHQHGPMHDED